MNDIKKLGLKYGTDKVTKHNYDIVYHDLFKDKRETVKKVLEIGVAEGAGLRMFRDYFPNAMIYGADNDPDRILKEDRIETHLCDQANFRDLVHLIDKIGGDIDLVVEDGSHKPNDQLFTSLYLLPLLKKGSVYIIEDVNVAFVDLLDVGLNKYEHYIQELPIVYVHRRRSDNRLVIIKR